MGNINWLGLWTLYRREVHRFLKVFNQTLFAPAVTTLLFLAVLTLSLGSRQHHPVEGIAYTDFIAPGLIMMAIVQNAFANTSSSLMLSKIQGVIIDLLMPPLSGTEITLGLTMGGLTRGMLVGIVVATAVYIFVPYHVHHWGIALFYLLASSLMLALIGLLTGIRSQSFDQLSAITNYVITPLSFLSGTFYSIRQLPAFWYHVCHFNPFFYMIDGFRYAFTGYADGSITIGIAVICITDLMLWCLAQHLISIGYKLKT
ncbi:MAG TPA: ABC transporter permease [Rickettsiales bacterium]|nr:ABC transporter permease [Rickettsiales bacterium]